MIELFRNDYRGSIGFLSTSQFISIFALILGILLFATKLFSKENPRTAVSEEETTDSSQD